MRIGSYVIAGTAALLVAGAAKADVVYESAELGATGQVGGYAIDEDQFIGSRFTLSATTVITAVGGHLEGDNGSSLFAAIIPVAAGQLPSFSPYEIESHALASALLTAPNESADVRTALSVTLAAGDYGLVFGGARFGATGDGGDPMNNIDTPEGAGSYFFSHAASYPRGIWGTVHDGGLRFVVEGHAATSVPEPSTLVLCGVAGLAALGLSRLRRKAA